MSVSLLGRTLEIKDNSSNNEQTSVLGNKTVRIQLLGNF